MTKKVKMPSNEDLAQMNQAQITALANQLGDRIARVELMIRWSSLKSNQHHRTERQKLADNQRRLAQCTVSKAELARLKRATELAHNAMRESVANQTVVINQQSQVLRDHHSRIGQHERAIIQLARTGQHLHQTAMNQVGQVVRAMCENGGQLEDDRRRSATRFDYVVRQAAWLRQNQKKEELARKVAEDRVLMLEHQVNRLDQEYGRAARFLTELPEMRFTRSLVLMGQSLKENLLGLCQWRPARVAIVAVFMVMIGAAYSHSEVSQAHAQGTAIEEAVIQCSFYHPKTNVHGIEPSYVSVYQGKIVNVLNCGNADDVVLFGTQLKYLPKDGIFARAEVVKLPQ